MGGIAWLKLNENAEWYISEFSQGGIYEKGNVVTLFVNVAGENADNVKYKWQWTEYSRNAKDGRYRGDIENANERTLIVPTSSCHGVAPIAGSGAYAIEAGPQQGEIRAHGPIA